MVDEFGCAAWRVEIWAEVGDESSAAGWADLCRSLGCDADMAMAAEADS